MHAYDCPRAIDLVTIMIITFLMEDILKDLKLNHPRTD